MKPLVTFLLFVVVQAPPQQSPPKASIEGFVLRAGTNEPLVRARVTVTRTGTTTATIGPVQGQSIPSVTTDNRGYFIVKDLEAGTYSVIAQRNGFARQTYGERAPNRGATPLSIVTGQAVKDLVFRLIPTGAVNGRVTDITGEPLPGINVTLLRSTYDQNGKRTFQPAGSTVRTNDHGDYRLYSLTPGRYYVSAGADRGGVAGLTPSGNDIVDPTYAQTYYPGTTDPSTAAALEIPPGTELNAIDFTLSQQRLFRIRGRVLDSRTGQSPRNANIMLMPRGGLFGTSGLLLGLNSYNASTGTFELRDVAPGSYTLNVDAIEPVFTAGAVPARNSARLLLEVSNTDVNNLVITFAPGITIPGRIVVDGGTAFSALPDRDRIRPLLSPVQEGGFSSGLPSVAEDGTFKLENVLPGDYRLNLSLAAAPGMYLKEARLGQTDVLAGLSINGPVNGGLEIVLSPKGAQVDGSVVDKDRKPVSGVQAVLIPDRQRDRRDLYKIGITDQNGHFILRSVPPGDYKLFAWEDIEPFAYNDPEILRKYEEAGVRVKLSESSTQTVEVKIIPAGQ